MSGAAVTAGAWWAIVPAGLLITVMILAATAVGRAIEEAMDPRLRAPRPLR